MCAGLNNNYNKKLKPLTRALRNNSTKSEIRMWCELLRRRQMLGFQFLRQRALDNYIGDFFCKELNLIIELDGITHHYEETYLKDLRKEAKLNQLGYTILRFADREVMENILGVGLAIEDWIKEHHADKLPDSQSCNSGLPFTAD